MTMHAVTRACGRGPGADVGWAVGQPPAADAAVAGAGDGAAPADGGATGGPERDGRAAGGALLRCGLAPGEPVAGRLGPEQRRRAGHEHRQEARRRQSGDEHHGSQHAEGDAGAPAALHRLPAQDRHGDRGPTGHDAQDAHQRLHLVGGQSEAPAERVRDQVVGGLLRLDRPQARHLLEREQDDERRADDDRAADERDLARAGGLGVGHASIEPDGRWHSTRRWSRRPTVVEVRGPRNEGRASRPPQRGGRGGRRWSRCGARGTRAAPRDLRSVEVEEATVDRGAWPEVSRPLARTVARGTSTTVRSRGPSLVPRSRHLDHRSVRRTAGPGRPRRRRRPSRCRRRRPGR